MPTAISTLSLLFLVSFIIIIKEEVAGIGINYGKLATNLPPPTQVAQFLSESTIFDRVKLFDADPWTLQAFANTGLSVDVAVANRLIPDLTDLAFAQRWVRDNVIPHVSATNIARILVGNEVISTANRSLIQNLVPAMQNIHTALVSVSLQNRIQVSTPHSLGILSASTTPPSAGKFRDGYDVAIIKPLLSFLRATGSPFMVNAYPFFGSAVDTLDYALFRINSGVVDKDTGLTYSNMLDAQLDAVYSAMKRLGFADIDIVVSETGWPTVGDEWEVGVNIDFARDYNKNLIRHAASGIGTPLMPGRTFDIYIFSLFNEDLKPGPSSERNFGLFHTNLLPVYDIGLLRTQAPDKNTASSMVNPMNPLPADVKHWCIAKPNADVMSLQENLDYVCGQGINCSPIQPGGECYFPETVQAHATYAMNAYFQASGQNAFDCDFGQTGMITSIDPSYENCKYNP
ncbi:glucan endo-1,3-beta-glucosidase-like [Typha angustifolia]|uniref:glucan endo-1,3-beta-glucosidase-like n=1 Tax=Typha angustifolia TaxID=59011 RepID=UPI003C2BE56D